MVFDGLYGASIAALGEFEVAEVLPYGRNADASACYSFASVGLGWPSTTLKAQQSFSDCYEGLHMEFDGLYGASFAALGEF
jgi:hypothetical protein